MLEIRSWPRDLFTSFPKIPAISAGEVSFAERAIGKFD